MAELALAFNQVETPDEARIFLILSCDPSYKVGEEDLIEEEYFG